MARCCVRAACCVLPPPSPALPAIRNKEKARHLVFFLFVSLAQTTPAQPAGGTSPSVGLLVKHDGAHSALNSAAREQTLAKIRDRKKAETGDRVTQHHAEFKQLSTQTKGDVGLFEATLHRTVARTEAEEVEIGETEKDNGHFSECPPCHEGGEIKRALRWSS